MSNRAPSPREQIEWAERNRGAAGASAAGYGLVKWGGRIAAVVAAPLFALHAAYDSIEGGPVKAPLEHSVEALMGGFVASKVGKRGQESLTAAVVRIDARIDALRKEL